MSELRDWLAFVHCRGMGPRTVYKLLQGFDSPQAILSASTSQLSSAGLSTKKINALREVDTAGIDRDLEWCDESDDRHIIPYYSNLYPHMLRQIADPPLVLFVRGDLEVLHTPQLAIVGSRKPSSSAAAHATSMAAQLSGYGLTICSGLAAGVDSCAHRGALQAHGLTIAVTATGLDRVYPAANQALAREIVQAGAIVSEFPIGTSPKPAYFPRRNRVISGLCFGTLVVEAALKSGTLTTAAHATEQSREVFAIPGNIDNPQSRGCHALIRNGATLVETIDDILVQLAPLLPKAVDFEGEKTTGNEQTVNGDFKLNRAKDETFADTEGVEKNPRATLLTDSSNDLPKETNPVASIASVQQNLSAELQTVLEAFDYTPLPLDAIVEATGIDIVSVTNLVFDLELNGVISRVAGGKYVKT